VLFIAWFAVRSVRIWGRSPHREKAFDAFDLSLARAGTVIVATLLLHSIVDYPLRTTAMMVVIAFACAVMVDPLVAAPEDDRASRRRRRPRSRRRFDPQATAGSSIAEEGQRFAESVLDLSPPARQKGVGGEGKAAVSGLASIDRSTLPYSSRHR
jgi:hypothetical protein